jgi:hypothetical protein
MLLAKRLTEGLLKAVPTLDPSKRTGSPSVRTASSIEAIASPTWHSADDHAVALLQWMQGPGGRVGEVPARDLMHAYADMCAEEYWEPLPWIPVAKSFRKLIRDPCRRLASRNSRRMVVYRIPRTPGPNSLA